MFKVCGQAMYNLGITSRVIRELSTATHQAFLSAVEKTYLYAAMHTFCTRGLSQVNVVFQSVNFQLYPVSTPLIIRATEG